MNASNLYAQLYSYLDTKTPFPWDCGRLCNKACCEGNEDDAGMYLFPRESEVYRNIPKWARIEKSDLLLGKNPVDILICDGTCKRSLRPLACRIFPLTPYVKDGKLSVIIDPRGRGLCPLTCVFDGFYDAVCNVSLLLYKIKETRQFIELLSEQINDYQRLF